MADASRRHGTSKIYYVYRYEKIQRIGQYDIEIK